MFLVERHWIKRSADNYKRVDKLCLLSKNLYNKANKVLKQSFHNNYCEKGISCLSYTELAKKASREEWEEYKALPAQTSQQILMFITRHWGRFKYNLLRYKEGKRKTKPRFPKLKLKEDDRFIVIFVRQQCKFKDNCIIFPKKANLIPLKTKVSEFRQVRIIPKNKFYVIEVLYEVKESYKDLDYNLYMGIDLGVNNLVAITSNKKFFTPIIINGKPLKSINQFFYKRLKNYKKCTGNHKYTKYTIKLMHKRNAKIDDYMHKTSKFIIDTCLENKIGNIVIGKNKGWKKRPKLGKVNNQTFISIPFSKLLKQIKYKAAKVGINVLLVDESYTSKCSFFDNEPIKKHNSYKGVRIHRGLFKASNGKFLNADVNASLNIIRKAVPNAFADGIEGIGLYPIKINL